MSEISVTLLKRVGQDAFYMQYTHPETGRKIPRTTGKTVRRDAERVAAKWEAELRAGRDNRLGRIRWEEFRRRYEDEVVAGFADTSAKRGEKRSENTIKAHWATFAPHSHGRSMLACWQRA
jgi:hypothetical protein